MQDFRDYRQACLKNLGSEVGWRLLNVTFDYLLERTLSLNDRKNLVRARLAFQAGHACYDTLYNKFSHGSFLPKQWEKMGSGQRVVYGAGKAIFLFQVADHLLGEWEYQVPQVVRNTAHCAQIGTEIYVGYDWIANTPWKDQQIYQYLGDGASYACGAAFVVSFGPAIGEGLVRGAYRIIYGKYSPKYENHAYLFTKELVQNFGGIAVMGLSHPDAVQMLWEGAKTAAEYIPVTVTPEQVAIGVAIVVIGGVAYYAYSRSR